MAGKPNQTKRHGTAMVEMAIALPLLLLLIVGALEFALQFHVRHCMVNAAREAARTLAVRGATVAQATQAANSQLERINAHFTVTSALPPPGQTDVSVQITVPRREVSLGMFAGDPGDVLLVRTTMRKEP